VRRGNRTKVKMRNAIKTNPTPSSNARHGKEKEEEEEMRMRDKTTRYNGGGKRGTRGRVHVRRDAHTNSGMERHDRRGQKRGKRYDDTMEGQR